ncbi:hypothetical protein [Mycobacterium avium]|uniref:hypothetical protein n=2 Tax=Mycobacterium avium TaxID=1764 RepID=UPI000A0438F7|nr:hypothetical protein [Mycobacterium avium]
MSANIGGEQVWNFPMIHAQIATLRGHAATIQAGNEQAQGALGKGMAVWSGEASTQWSIEQGRLNHRAQEFQLAVTDYLNAVENATFGQEHQEAVNQASFL